MEGATEFAALFAEHGPAWMFAAALLFFGFGFVIWVMRSQNRAKTLQEEALLASRERMERELAAADKRFEKTMTQVLQVERDARDRLLADQQQNFTARLAVWERMFNASEEKLDHSQAQFLRHLQEASTAEVQSREQVAGALRALSDRLAMDSGVMLEIKDRQEVGHRHTHDLLFDLKSMIERYLSTQHTKYTEIDHQLETVLRRLDRVLPQEGIPAP